MSSKKLLYGLGIFLIISGCSQPGFNPNNQTITFVDGKPYRVPIASTVSPHAFTQSKHDQIRLKANRNRGLDCRVGDVVWMEPSVLLKFADILKLQGKQVAIQFIDNAAREGKVGCSHPMSDKEFKYYSQQFSQRDAQMAAKQALIIKNMQNTIPKTYNVNVQHSGYINVHNY